MVGAAGKENLREGMSLRMAPPTVKGVFEIQINYTELEKRVQQYIQTEGFQRDLADAANDYRRLELPVPSAEVLRDQEIAALRRAMETVMICEAKGHLWKEKADPENGTSTLMVTEPRTGALEQYAPGPCEYSTRWQCFISRYFFRGQGWK